MGLPNVDRLHNTEVWRCERLQLQSSLEVGEPIAVSIIDLVYVPPCLSLTDVPYFFPFPPLIDVRVRNGNQEGEVVQTIQFLVYEQGSEEEVGFLTCFGGILVVKGAD